MKPITSPAHTPCDGCRHAERCGALRLPRAAWQCFVALLEFSVPKLSRAEVTGQDGAPLNFMITVPPKAAQ